MEISRRLLSLVLMVVLSSSAAMAESGVYSVADEPGGAVWPSVDCCGAHLADDCTAVDKCAGSCCECAACASQQNAPWALPQPCLLQNMGIKVGGWLQQGITFNAYHSRRRLQRPGGHQRLG